MDYKDNPGVEASNYKWDFLSRLRPSEAVAFKDGFNLGTMQTLITIKGALSQQHDVTYRLRPFSIQLDRLKTLSLSSPISVILESDSDGYIARTSDMPLYGYGDDIIEALDVLKIEIESLYFELMENDEFREEWLNIKKYLKTKVLR